MSRPPTILERLTRQPLPGLDHPTQLRFSQDGEWVVYLQPERRSNVRSLWRHDLSSGERRVLVSGSTTGRPAPLERGEELLRQRRRESGLGLARYRAAAKGDCFVAVQRGRCLVSRDGQPAEALGPWDDVQDALPSPDGGRIALVRRGDLWIAPAAGDPLRLTHSAAPGAFNGLAEYIAAEELDRFDGCWWSADGGALAWASVDERHVPEIDIAHATRATRGAASPDRHRYPFAGAANARVTLVVCDLAGGDEGRAVDLDIGDGYLARVVPHPAGGWLAAVLPRDQRTLRWWRVAATGAAAGAWEERADPWVNLDDATRVLSDGRVLRATEATGFRHLELRSPDGTVERRLTGGAWTITDVAHCDERRGEVLFVSTADGAPQRHLYAVPLDAAAPVERPARLTADPGWHAVVAAPDGSRWIDTWSTREHAPAVVVRSRAGHLEAVIHRASTSARRRHLVVPELRVLTAGDGRTKLHAALFDPPAPAGSPPPAVVWVYGGPHVQHVRDAWELTVHPLRQALTDAGFVVMVVDGRGSANRGLRFESPLAGALGTAEVDDQAAAVEALTAEGRIDGTRVAITGGSYGGYMTIRCLMRRPGCFRAGVAVAPVVDWTRYDTGYTERYLGTPQGGADAYARASLTDEASRLDGDLLVIHGTLDENVHPRHTERLLEALAAAGRRVEVLWLGGERHRTQSRRQVLRRDRRTVSFLRRALGLDGPGPDQAATSYSRL